MRSRLEAAHVEVEALVRLCPAIQGAKPTITPLAGGITNRNYRIDADGESVVLRIGGDGTELLGIDRNVEYASSLAAARAGVGPEVISFLPEHRALVTRFVSGRVLTPEDTQQPSVMRRVVEILRRYHDGPPGAGHFSAFETVTTYQGLARDRSVQFPSEMQDAIALLARLQTQLIADEPACPCHNDLLPANLIDDGQSVWIIDWEYGGMGDRFFDLGNFAANHLFEERHEEMLLELYFGEVRPGELRRLRLMRIVSDMRESMWGFLQSGISTLDFEFYEYGRTHLRRFLDAASAMEGEPLRTGS